MRISVLLVVAFVGTVLFCGTNAFLVGPMTTSARLAGLGSTRQGVDRFHLAPACVGLRQRQSRVSMTTSSAPVTNTKVLMRAPIMDKYELMKEDFVDEYGAKVLMLKHKKTGAEIMSVSVPDENKVFGITFRTPPSDSTGVPHILEHSVLSGGSCRYPVKQPFVELLKGSMKTFLNAFTMPDRTCYPVASQNLKDFYNLVNVYLDSVLHPNLTPWILKQEGWHYEIDDIKDPLTYKGVVFNEMKGAYSSPDAVHGRAAQRAVFPDNTYGVCSGGDPRVIPQLTYEDFSGFHKKFYHPTNSRIYFYGDDDVEARLELLESFLGEFEALPEAPKESVVMWQKKQDAPRVVEQEYPAGKDGKILMTVNWLVNDKELTLQEELAMEVLNRLLVGTPVAPLYKALRESGLGESVLASGFGTSLQQATFSVGMKGISEPSKVDDVEKIALATLQRLANEGFEASAVEAALNSLEFGKREFNTGGFPRGLSFMINSLSSWVYDKDPIAPLRFEKPLADLRASLERGDKIFEELITKCLLENKHKVVVKSFPNAELEAVRSKEEADKLKEVKESLSEDDLKMLVEETRALKERQEAQDPPEKLALVPTLNMNDLDRQGRNIPIDVGSEKSTTVLRHDLPTNGIIYTDVGFDLRALPLDLMPYIPLFCRCLSEMGTTDMDDVSFSRYIQTHTGGVSASYSNTLMQGAGSAIPDQEVVSHLILRGKAMYGKNKEMFRVLNDMLMKTNLNNKAKFLQMVLETKARMEATIIGSGQSLAATRIGSRYNVAELLAEKMSGVDYIHFIRQLAQDVETDWEGVLSKLEKVRNLLADRKGMIVNLSAEQKGMDAVQDELEAYIESIPLREGETKIQDWAAEMKKFEGVGEGFQVTTQVNYVGKGGEMYDIGEEASYAAVVVSRYLRTSYLWDQVRVLGGAYGARNEYQPVTGIYKSMSYRDPNLKKTLETYDAAPKFLMGLSKDLSASQLSNAIIGMIGDIDAPMSPDQKGFASMNRYLTGVTDDSRQRRREEVLGTTAKDFKEFGERLERVASRGTVAVVGSEAALKESMDLKLDIQKIL